MGMAYHSYLSQVKMIRITEAPWFSGRQILMKGLVFVGYDAYCGGSVFIRPGDHLERIENAMNNSWYDFERIDTDKTCNGEPLIEYCIYFEGSYHDESVWEILGIMEPFVAGGCLYFRGEDESVWRFVFRDGHFKEECAEYYYVTDECIKNAEQVLIDNGVAPDEAETVLQAIGYVLLDTDLYPDGRVSQ